jgi:phospholipid transport system substrate-binding protein
MASVYAQRFGSYRGSGSFKVTGQREENNVAMVNTEIGRPDAQQPAKVTWQLAKTPNGYKITDVSIEGVSQALTYRQEFESVISQNGGQLSALTQQLRDKAKANG